MKDKTFALTGSLTINTAQKNLLAIQRAVNDGTLIVDLAEVESCDSAGIALLIEAKKYTKQQNNQILSYINQPQQLKDFATFLKVDAVLFQ